mmetsp:Transcript_63267/g.76040  ORF Transcript_63267/g.76040 Transcript_63267/m.76040 type:complete len:201 (-) Transcript_63267:87-689(-)
MERNSDVSNHDSKLSSPPQSMTVLHILNSQAEWHTTAISSSGRCIRNSVKNRYTRSDSSKGSSRACGIHSASSSPCVIKLKSMVGKSTLVCEIGNALLHVKSPSCSRQPSCAKNGTPLVWNRSKLISAVWMARCSGETITICGAVWEFTNARRERASLRPRPVKGESCSSGLTNGFWEGFVSSESISVPSSSRVTFANKL